MLNLFGWTPTLIPSSTSVAAIFWPNLVTNLAYFGTLIIYLGSFLEEYWSTPSLTGVDDGLMILVHLATNRPCPSLESASSYQVEGCENPVSDSLIPHYLLIFSWSAKFSSSSFLMLSAYGLTPYLFRRSISA